ncbi:MAG: hypothetical protein K2I96_05425 [Lachnospiraceae bacterium]|nr:hypothetical protein [Lachnospiraceae bacterium]
MKKTKTITIKVTEADYNDIKQRSDKEGLSISDYIRSYIKKDISKDWIRKIAVQKNLSRVAATLDKYGEKNKCLTDEIRKELSALWNKL